MRRTRSQILIAAGLCLAVAGCGGGGTAAPSTVAPTSAPPATVVASSSSTPASEAPTSTTQAPEVAPTATLPADVVGLSPDGPWHLVDSAPGITTPGLVYELMPKLWVYLPLEEDLDHGITWTFNEADRPIIEAYLQARLVFFRVTETNPFDLEDPGWQQWYADGGASYRRVLTARSARGEVFDRDAGVVLRPTVIGDMRTDEQGVVFDCMLDGGVWRLPDGSLGEGSTPGVVSNGVSAVVTQSESAWQINGLAGQPEACT